MDVQITAPWAEKQAGAVVVIARLVMDDSSGDVDSTLKPPNGKMPISSTQSFANRDREDVIRFPSWTTGE